MNNFEIKKRIVEAGNSMIFKNWSEHSSITMEEFIEALEWLCNDELDNKGRMTREIGLSPVGIVMLTRCYETENICTFYKNGHIWMGETFIRKAATDKEKRFYGDEISETHKISLSCRDRV